MSKGLEALHHPRIELAQIDISAEGKHGIAYMPFYKTKQYTAIEKELRALEILKNHDMVRYIEWWGLSKSELNLIKEWLER